MDEPVPLEPVPSWRAFAQAPRTSGYSITSLLLGLLSFFCSIILGPLAIIFGIAALRGIRRSSGELKGQGLAIAGIVLGAVMTFILTPVLLIPAIKAAREAAWRNQSVHNMNGIAIALQNYHEARHALPASKNERNSQLSWRVHLLPYMDQQELYAQFHLDEPWDSPHNRTLIDKMPDVFKTPGANLAPGETAYLAVTGPDTAFGDGTQKLKFRDFTDGTSQTILFVEADKGVPWTKPDDWQLGANKPGAGLGQLRRFGFWAGFADATVQYIDNNTPDAQIKAWMTPAGGD